MQSNPSIPGKFKGTGFNTVELYGRPQNTGTAIFPIDAFAEATTEKRQKHKNGIESLEFSERQSDLINRVSMNAIQARVSEIMGGDLDIPTDFFVDLMPEEFFSSNNIAGAYYSEVNHIGLVDMYPDPDSPEALANITKVFMHEYFHFLSNQYGLSRGDTPNSVRVGFRFLGKDIREQNKGKLTRDYFLSFNEGVTEMLALETFGLISQDSHFIKSDGQAVRPHEAYKGYRELVDRFMDDAIEYEATGLSKADLWRMITKGYINGDLKHLTALVRSTYPGISIREFGLITDASELPTREDFVWTPSNGGGGKNPRLSSSYLQKLRIKLQAKPKSDYDTDINSGPLPPDPPSTPEGFGDVIRTTRQKMLQEAKIQTKDNKVFTNEQGQEIHEDNNGNKIYSDQDWLVPTLEYMQYISSEFKSGNITEQEALFFMDDWLFRQNKISILSDGFEGFYVAKHMLFSPETTQEDFDKYLGYIDKKIALLREQ